MKNSLAIALKEAHDAELNSQDLTKVLMSIIAGIERMDVASARALSAGYIHALFTKQSMSVHSLLLQIICELEASVPPTTVRDNPSGHFTFLEQHSLDRLVVQSLESRHPDPQPRIDDEKNSALRVVSLLLKLRGYLPASLVRSLVSLYNTPKHCYKELIVSYLCRAAILCPRVVASVPEVGQIIVDRLAETGAKELSGLVCYSAENSAEFVQQQDFVSHLLFPLTKIGPGDEKDEDVVMKCTTAVADVLSTWPGLIYYGLQNGILRDLVRMMRHRASAVIQILKHILRINETKGVLDGYLGLLMSGLKKLEFVEELHVAAKDNVDAALFLNYLMPYLSCVASTVDIVPTAMKVSNSSESRQRISMAHLIHPSGMKDEETKVTSIRDLKGELNFQKDWQKIHRIITVILPHNEDEFSSPQGREFCLKVLDSFVTPVTDEANKKVAADCLYSLLDLMLSHGKKDVLLQAGKFLESVGSTLVDMMVKKEEQQLARDINWVLFKCIFVMLKDEEGAELLVRRQLVNGLCQIGGVCKSVDTAKRIFDAFTMSSTGGIASKFLLQFLSNKNYDIFTCAIEKIRSMVNTVEGFEESVFKQVVLEYVKNISSKHGEDIPTEHRNILINLLYEIMLKSDTCLEFAAEDENVHKFLDAKGKIVYSLLFSKEKGCQVGNVDEQINWWIEKGNRKYVKVFDTAVLGKAAVGKTDPAIVGDPPLVPSHLFSQLAKTKLGREKIIQNLPRLCDKEKLDGSESLSERRGIIFAICHFASEESTHETIKKMGLFKYVMDQWSQPSYVLKGTIISGLSLVAKSKDFTEFLIENSWQIYKFGSHTAAVPCDITKGAPSNRLVALQTIEEVEAMEEQTLLIRQMASPIAVRNARDQLARMYQESRDELVCRDLAVYAHDYMARFCLPPDSRAFLMKIFNSIPLVYIDIGDIDQRECAEVRARIREVCKKSTAEELSTVKIPRYTRAELTKKDRVALIDRRVLCHIAQNAHRHRVGSGHQHGVHREVNLTFGRCQQVFKGERCSILHRDVPIGPRDAKSDLVTVFWLPSNDIVVA